MDIPAAVRRRLGDYLRACAGATTGFRWAPAANLHLTLRFCGGLEEEVVTTLRHELRSVAGAAFSIALGGVGTFGGRRPRVVWLQVAQGGEPLARLAADVEEACRAAGLEPEERPFRAHLTLGRATGAEREPMPRLPEPPALEPWLVGSFALYESRLGRGPAVYSLIEDFPLSPGS